MALGQCPVGSAERRQDLAGVQQVEEIDQGDVRVRFQVDLQVAHEPARGHPEVVADHARSPGRARRRTAAGRRPARCSPRPCRAKSHCSNWSSTSSTFWPGRSVRPRRSAARASTRPSPGPARGTPCARPCSSRASVSAGGRLDVNRQHMLGQPGQQPRLDQRRLAAARGTVDQADPEGGVGVGRLDPGLPEPEALGQAVAIAGAGQELEEEVGVVLVERPQPLGDDLDGGPTRGRIRGGRSRRGLQGRAGRRGGRPAGRSPARGAVGLEEVPQVLGQVAGRAVPLRRPLGQHLLADPLQLAGDRVVDLPGRTRLDGGDLIHDLGMRVAPERPAAGEQLVEDDAQAEDVRAAIDPVPLAPGLLGAHVGRRPGQPGPLAVVLVPQRQPEVGDARLARRVEQDVGRLDVAVDQAPRVGVVQRLGDRRHQLGRLPKGQPALPHPLRQVAALDVLGDDVAEAVVGPADVVDRDDVRSGRAGRGRGPRPGRPRRPRGRRPARGWAP